MSLVARKVLDPDAPGEEGLTLLLKDLPENTPDRIDGYYWFWGSTALGRIDGRAGARFGKWMPAATRTLLDSQFVKGCAQGSWESAIDRWGFEGGRVAVTALNTLTLLTAAR
jgi:hypothetical protein